MLAAYKTSSKVLIGGSVAGLRELYMDKGCLLKSFVASLASDVELPSLNRRDVNCLMHGTNVVQKGSFSPFRALK